jgi:hypothetical protein
MQGSPDVDLILAAVAGFLRDEAMPALTGHAAFSARVAANAIDLARREIAAPGPAIALAEGAHDLIGPVAGDPAAALCAAIREGRIGLDTPGLAPLLWRDVLARVAIDQPNYASFREIANRKEPS